MKKFLSLAAFALMATSAMAQVETPSGYNGKAYGLMNSGKLTEAISLIEADLAKTDNEVKVATEKAAAKGKPADLGKLNAKYAGLYNQVATCWAQIFNPQLLHAANSEPLDTALFVKSLDNMVNYYTKSYEYDHTPNLKGKVSPKFDADNFRFVESCVDYYFYAAIFCNQNGDKKGAMENFKKHINLPYNPVLASKKDALLKEKKDNYEQSAYYCTLLNYEQKNWKEILESVDAGLSNKEYNHDLYLIKAEAVLQTTKDTLQYINVLKDAIFNVENNQSFSESLLSVYYDRQDADGALAVVEDLIARNPGSKTPWYMKGCVLLNIKHEYSAARECFEKALAIDPDDLLANANMSYAWTNEVVTRRQNGQYKYIDKKTVTGQKNVDAYKAELEEIRNYYKKALPYMEKVRVLAADRSKVWAPALQQIYYNLGMDAEAQQMDDIMASNH